MSRHVIFDESQFPFAKLTSSTSSTPSSLVSSFLSIPYNPVSTIPSSSSSNSESSSAHDFSQNQNVQITVNTSSSSGSSDDSSPVIPFSIDLPISSIQDITSLPPNTSYHPMITRSKDGKFLPKAIVVDLEINEPKSVP